MSCGTEVAAMMAPERTSRKGLAKREVLDAYEEINKIAKVLDLLELRSHHD